MPRYQLPGVYVQEIATAVPSISPSPTSRALFIGRCTMGPVGVPVKVNSVSEFHANFGTGVVGTTLDRAVELFFDNDGKELIVVRVFSPDPQSSAPPKAVMDLGAFSLEAASEGLWGRRIMVSVGLAKGSRPTRKQGLREGESFNLEVMVSGTGMSVPAEVHSELTMGDGPRRVDKVLEEGSRIVRFKERCEKAKVVSEGRFPAVGGSDGLPLDASNIIGADGGGMNALDRTDGFDILYIPPYREDQIMHPSILSAAADRCRANRAILLLDAPRGWSTVDDAKNGIKGIRTALGDAAKDAALYFPNLLVPDGPGHTLSAPAAGAVAGVIARNDSQRGVWKTPAGIEAVIEGASDIALSPSDNELSTLNMLAINCLRKLPDGRVVIWGGRTLDGADLSSSEWKYLPVRRLSLFIEKSLHKGLEWTVFEPNDRPLWSKVRASVEAFLLAQFHKGAFQGTVPRDAFFVRCGNDTTSAEELKKGALNLHVGFAALKPAEFIILRLQLRTGT